VSQERSDLAVTFRVATVHYSVYSTKVAAL